MLLTTPSSLYNAFVNKKLEVMSNNSSRKSGHLSPPYSPNNNSANCDRKRVAEAASLPANAQAEQQPNKRPYSPSSRREDTQHNLQWRSNLMSASLLGASQDAHNRLNEYHNTLLANSLANRQAEQLFQRQLLSHYLAPQLRINSLSAFATNPAALGIASFSSRGGGQVPASSQSLASLLSLRQSNDAFAGTAARFPDASFTQGGAQAINISPLQQQVTLSTLPQESSRQQQQEEEIASIGEAAASITGQGQKFSQEKSIPLGIDEDCCWLSDFHVFVRKNLVELCWASNEDVALRSASNRVSSHQVGIRCKCCAHLSPSARAQRSSAFPSSVAQIYQSFTMMLRAHFSSCSEVPPVLRERFLQLKSKTTQGATDSKQYWIYSAKKLGMVDSEEGIAMTNKTMAVAAGIPPFGTSAEDSMEPHVPLASPNDRNLASDFLYTLMLQARRVKLQANEQRGNKKSLQLGLPGFACRHCCQLGRMGQCRIFPARRRTLPIKIYDLYEHLQRCTVCPKETKDLLELLHQRENYQAKTPGHKEFLDMIWTRLVEQS